MTLMILHASLIVKERFCLRARFCDLTSIMRLKMKITNREADTKAEIGREIFEVL